MAHIDASLIGFRMLQCKPTTLSYPPIVFTARVCFTILVLITALHAVEAYRVTKGPCTLSLKIRMKHGHPPAGDPPEITVFADSMVRGGFPLPQFIQSGRDDRRVWARYNAALPIKEAKLRYTTDHTAWVDRSWETAPAELREKEKEIEAILPTGTTAYYLDLIDERGCIVSSPHDEMNEPSRD